MASTVWKGHLAFGLVSIPISLIRAARAERVNLHQLRRAAEAQKPRRADVIELPVPQDEGGEVRRAGAREVRQSAPRDVPEAVERVSRAMVTPEDERPVPAAELVKGYEYQPDRWVLLEPDDIKQIAPKTSKVMQVVEFVRFGEIDPVYLESSYYVLPDRNGAKPYAIFYEALRQTEYAAVAEVAMHGREHIVILRPGRTGLVGHTMFFENEVRKQDEYRTDTSLASGRELELAELLIGSLAGPFTPEKYRDTYREKLESLIAAKMQGRDVAETNEAKPAPEPALDLMEALRKSLEVVRKPPAPAAKPKKRAARPS